MSDTSSPARAFPAALIASLAITFAGCSAAVVKPPAAQAPAAATPAIRAPIYDTDEERILHVYNWKEYMDPRALEQFTRETGIEINYHDLESNDLLDAKLRAGHSGYDVVFPSGKFLHAQIGLGVYQALDKSKLTNLGNLDPNVSVKLARFDPGNAHAVDYMFGTLGIAYNVAAVEANMPNAPLDSLAMIWDPKVVSKFANCGVAVVDSPSEVVGSALIYLGKDPNSERPEDLAAAEKVIMAARPYIRLIDSDYVDELAAGEICLGLDWSGDTLQSKSRAWRDRRPHEIGYRLPREGTFIFLDAMAIPADASHVKNAHIFVDYLLREDVAAKNSRFTGFPNGNALSWLLTGDEIFDDQNFFPPPSVVEKLTPDLPESEEFKGRLGRTWWRFHNGRRGR